MEIVIDSNSIPKSIFDSNSKSEFDSKIDLINETIQEFYNTSNYLSNNANRSIEYEIENDINITKVINIVNNILEEYKSLCPDLINHRSIKNYLCFFTYHYSRSK